LIGVQSGTHNHRSNSKQQSILCWSPRSDAGARERGSGEQLYKHTCVLFGPFAQLAPWSWAAAVVVSSACACNLPPRFRLVGRWQGGGEGGRQTQTRIPGNVAVLFSPMLHNPASFGSVAEYSLYMAYSPLFTRLAVAGVRFTNVQNLLCRSKSVNLTRPVAQLCSSAQSCGRLGLTNQRWSPPPTR